MSSAAVKVILGVSVLAMTAGFAACDNGTQDNGGSGPIVVAGTGNSTGGSAPQGTGGSTATGGSGTATGGSGTATGGGGNSEGVPITPVTGWIAKESNALGIQGAAFSFADDTSKVGMTDNLMDATATAACIKGTAAKVDMTSTACTTKMFTPPAMDCYGQYWGAALGFNLNQTIDMTTMMGGTPMAFDGSSIDSFYFEISDHDDHSGVVPGPSALRFKIDDGTNEFCNPAMVKVKLGPNTIKISDLVEQCWTTTDPPQPNATTVQSKMIKISWQVVTNASSTVPFDFCVGNVRAILKAGAVLPPAGTGGSSSTGAGGSAPAAGGSAPASGGSASASAGSSAGGSSAGGSSAAGASSAGKGGGT